jgi:UDP-N-acetylglucosamine--N-acetylmuramyl-(pentapeptide) pyrophosphoryl-undecaprenol N-acetylglucosamine transferase
MKILITGTHLTPALAVIDELKNQSNIELVYIGRNTTMEGDSSRSVESKVFDDLGIKFLPLVTGRLQRSLTPYTLFSLFKIPVGFMQAIYYLFYEKPDVVLSFGGYVSVPVVICSWLLNIKIIIHEQTLFFGFSNKICSYFADVIAVSFPQIKLPDKRMIFTGNPIRKEILEPSVTTDQEIKKIIILAKKESKPLILITGGNQGSHFINNLVIKDLKKIVEMGYIIHQTGDSKYKDFDELEEFKKSLPKPEKYLVRKWIDGKDFGYILKNTDLSISRSGMNTLQELAFFGIPTISIPLPNSINNEQTINAKYFEKAGSTKTFFQSDLTAQNLLAEIKIMLNNLSSLKENAKEAKNIIIPDAAKRIALETILLSKKL